MTSTIDVNTARTLIAAGLLLLGPVVPADADAQRKEDSPLTFRDTVPQHYQLNARASEIDPRVTAHPEIDFLIETKDGKPADTQHASVDTRVARQTRDLVDGSQ